jgi:hypothetical protein
LNRFDEAAKTWDTKPSSLAMAKACVENINKIIKLKNDAKILDYINQATSAEQLQSPEFIPRQMVNILSKVM